MKHRAISGIRRRAEDARDIIDLLYVTWHIAASAG
jgi:hypothetical protein